MVSNFTIRERIMPLEQDGKDISNDHKTEQDSQEDLIYQWYLALVEESRVYSYKQ